MEIERNTKKAPAPHEVRTVKDNDGSYWFVVADVCRVFGIKHVRIPVGDKSRRWLQTVGGQQLTAVLSKQGVYGHAVSSKKPSARHFMQRTLFLLSVDALRFVIEVLATTRLSEIDQRQWKGA